MKKLFLLDGNSLCYRAFYAIPALSNSKGRPTNAVYGFITMLNKILKEEKPDYVAISFDMKEPTFRHKKFTEYKIHRKPMPDELVSQIPLIKEVVDGYGIARFEMPGFEADDIIATITKKCSSEDLEICIVTGDKDALQLVNERVKVYSPHSKEVFIYNAGKVKEKFGVEPQKMVDLMSLMGDSSDNISGVTGIGPKTAVKLIEEFSTLENLLNNLDNVKREPVRELLKQGIEQARLSYELATLDYNVPVHIDLDKMRVNNPDNEKLYKLFKELEFKGMLKNFASSSDSGEVDYVLIDTQEKFENLLKELNRIDEFALDFETTSTDAMLAHPVGISFCWREKVAYYVPLKKMTKMGTDTDNINGVCPHFCLQSLKPILENPKIGKIGQNIKYEILILKNQGIELKGVIFDTMVASYLLNPSKLNHNLEDIAIDFLDYRMSPTIEDLLGKGKTSITMDQVALDKICRYCCQDSDITFRLKKILQEQLRQKELYDLFCKIELPLIAVLADIEWAGVSIDVDYLNLMSEKFKKDLDKLTKQIYEIAGEEFNINSPKQLSFILFEKLKLPVKKKTKTGISTNEEVLQKLASQHALPAAILEYRQLFKLKSTYIDALPAMVNAKTGRVHTSFNQTVTSTGRLSSSSPNLQNIPIRTEAGRNIRKAFIPSSEKYKILSVDYSQIELRILAHMSGDENMMEAFKKDLDIHTHTASLIYGIKEQDVAPAMRSSAKTINFGIIYGMSPYGLSKDLGINPDEAKIFIDAYFARYPKIQNYMQEVIQQAKSRGFVTTFMNRRRWIPEISSPNINMRQFAQRTAINMPIQGSAADLIKIAMIEIHKFLTAGNYKTEMIMQVHDELVFNLACDEADEIVSKVKEIMENAVELKVPLKASVKVGDNWLEAQ